MRTIALAGIMLATALALGLMVAQSPPSMMLLGMTALAIFLLTFINVEWGLYILIFSMLLSPEIMVGATGGNSLGRGVTLRLEDALLLIIGLSWFARNAVFKELGLFLRTPLNKPILFYMLACILSTGFGVIGGSVQIKTGFLYVLKYFEYFIVFFMVVNHTRSRSQAKRFIFCLFLTALLAAAAGMVQTPSGERVSAPFEDTGEPNTLGGYLLFIGMTAAGIASKVKKGRTRYLLIFLIVCLMPPFFLTQSRSSYLALALACLAFGWMSERRLIIMGLIAVGFLLSPLFLPDVVKQRIAYTFNQPEDAGQIAIGDVRLDSSTSARLESWNLALKNFALQPIMGYGVTGYSFVDAQIPRVLIETGLIGLVTFLYLLYSIFKLARSRLSQTEDPFFKGLAMGFMAGFAGLVVHALGVNTFIIVRIMEPFWFFAGIITVLPVIAGEAASVPPKRIVRGIRSAARLSAPPASSPS
jgi:O-antigen ligase